MSDETGKNWPGALSISAAAVLSLAVLTVPVQYAEAQTRVHAGDQPEYHVIVQGDTIWDLSGSYFGDPYQWPRVWSYNPHITNPHWIYPGDILYLTDMERGEGAGLGADDPAAAGAGVIEQRRLFSDDQIGLYLAQGGMILVEEEVPVGRIIGAPKSGRLLAEHDDIWVGFGERAYREDEREEMGDDELLEVEDVDVEVGDRFAIIRQDGELKDDEGETVGIKYYVLGSATITEVPENEEVARTAIIDHSWREIERGDILVPYERQRRLIQPRQADEDLVARVVDSLDQGTIFGPQQYLFVDRGAEDGVRPGNRFFVYQQWEGFEDPREQSAPEIPWQQVGQVMVIDVREQYSMVVITRSDREVYIGDRLEMYRGY